MRKAWWVGGGSVAAVGVAVLVGWYVADDDGLSRGEVRDMTREAVQDVQRADFRDQLPGTAQLEIERGLDLAAGRRDVKTPLVKLADYAVRDTTASDGPSGLMTFSFDVGDKGGKNAVCVTLVQRADARGRGVGLYDISLSDGTCPRSD